MRHFENKKRNHAALSAAALLIAVSCAACSVGGAGRDGGNSAGTDSSVAPAPSETVITITEDEAKVVIKEIIPKAAVFYANVFNGGGYFKEDASVSLPGADAEDLFVLVADDNIKSIADIKAMTEEVFTPEVAEVRFYGYFRNADKPAADIEINDAPLYYDYDGRLYVCNYNGGHGFAFDWLYDTIKITELSDTAITARIDRTLFDEFDETSEIRLVKASGRWLVANDFIDMTDS